MNFSPCTTLRLRNRTHGPGPAVQNLRRRKPRIGIALSGGGAKASAHIGVLQALTDMGLRFDKVAGTSGGALAGAFFCDGHTPLRMHELLKAELMRRSWRNWLPYGRYWQLSRLFKPEGLHGIITRHVRAQRFEELEIPFFVTSTDLIRGEAVTHSQGDVARAVLASMSIPGFSPPVPDGDRLLVDGGVLSYLPAEVLRQNGADVVIAVDLGDCNAPVAEWTGWSRRGALDVVRRAWAIQNRALTKRQVEHADVIIRPRVSEFCMADLARMDEMVQRGREAGSAALSRIQAVLESWENAEVERHRSTRQVLLN